MTRNSTKPIAALACCAALALCLIGSGCAHAPKRRMTVTAYCGCSQCCGWTRGSWKYLKLNVWNRYYASGPARGKPYRGYTASRTRPREPNPGLVSLDSLVHPWMIPLRILFFPWLLVPHPGTVAADTNYYPFGTVMDIPGYGKGIVEDRGSAIRGPNRIDIFYHSHSRALQWGRQKIPVVIKKR